MYMAGSKKTKAKLLLFAVAEVTHVGGRLEENMGRAAPGARWSGACNWWTQRRQPGRAVAVLLLDGDVEVMHVNAGLEDGS